MVYQGGKSKYAKYIVPILQKAIDESGYTTFIDGCCGGCAIIDKIKCNKRIAIDNDKYLIAFLKKVAEEGTDFIPEATPSKEEWNSVKNNKENYPDWYVGLVKHLCSYNGRGFVGSYGASYKFRNYYDERRRNIVKQASNLCDIQFIVDDVNNLKYEKTVIYLDPPYSRTEKYDSIVDNPFDYGKFWDTVRRLSRDNLVFVSSEIAPEDFECIWQKSAKRNIGTSDKIAIEGLFKLKL